MGNEFGRRSFKLYCRGNRVFLNQKEWIGRDASSVPYGRAGAILVVAASLTLLCYIAFPVPKLGEGEKNFYLESWPQIALISITLTFPVAFLSGILFPAIAARVQESVPSRMNSLGITTLFNTTGAAIGPLLAGFVLLPKLGFQSSLIVCAIGYGILCPTISQGSYSSPKRPALQG